MKVPSWGRKFRIHNLLLEVDPVEGYLLTEKSVSEDYYVTTEALLLGSLTTEKEEFILTEDGALTLSAEYVEDLWVEDSTYLLTEDSEIMIGG